MLSPLGG